LVLQEEEGILHRCIMEVAAILVHQIHMGLQAPLVQEFPRHPIHQEPTALRLDRCIHSHNFFQVVVEEEEDRPLILAGMAQEEATWHRGQRMQQQCRSTTQGSRLTEPIKEKSLCCNLFNFYLYLLHDCKFSNSNAESRKPLQKFIAI
jgi:hypothetical protein